MVYLYNTSCFILAWIIYWYIWSLSAVSYLWVSSGQWFSLLWWVFKICLWMIFRALERIIVAFASHCSSSFLLPSLFFFFLKEIPSREAISDWAALPIVFFNYIMTFLIFQIYSLLLWVYLTFCLGLVAKVLILRELKLRLNCI